MNFNDKLINLRKKAGLSQEELGYKLNVTRQTISKWELAQSTPEMDKLIELSKIFNISLDDLTNKEEIFNNTEKNNNLKKKSNKVLLIVFIIGLIIGISTIVIGVFKQNNVEKTNKQLYEKAQEELQSKLSDARKRIDEINVELEDLNTSMDNLTKEESNLIIGSSNWINKKSEINHKKYNIQVQINNLQAEKTVLENTEFDVSYAIIEPITYRIFYYIGAAIIVCDILTVLIIYLILKNKSKCK